MYLKYKIYNPETKIINEEICKFLGVYYDEKECIAYFAFGGFDDVLVNMDNCSYKCMLSSLEAAINAGKQLFVLNEVGLCEDYDYEEDSWEKHLETLCGYYKEINQLLFKK